jgi:hypothetical protein
MIHAIAHLSLKTRPKTEINSLESTTNAKNVLVFFFISTIKNKGLSSLDKENKGVTESKSGPKTAENSHFSAKQSLFGKSAKILPPEIRHDQSRG